MTDAKHIGGNLAHEEKESINKVFEWLVTQEPVFAPQVGRKIRMTEMDLIDDPVDSTRKTYRAVAELDVDENMVNANGTLHGGCAAYLLDVCTTAVCFLHPQWKSTHVSAALDVKYHSAAPLGCHLKIISTVVSSGARLITTRCEIYNWSTKTLAVSGTHMKMNVPAKGPRPARL